MSKLLIEIKRRHVFQTFIPYLGFVWLFLQIVSVVSPMLNWHPLVNTFFAVVLFAGIPVMLYLSWYFDFTMQGLMPIKDKNAENASPFGFVRWTLLLVITASSGSFGYQYFHEIKVELAKTNEGVQQQIHANSIAVLPFKDNSPDQDQAFLAQGLAEEITSLLGRTNGLTVSASSSTTILKDKGLDPVSIARKLGVQTVLTGSVRKTGDQLKVIVELLNAEDGTVLWTENFARKFKDIFKVETEIARSTVNLLQDTYIESGSLSNPASSKNVDAYVIYLKGREQYRLQTTESMKTARKLFEQAVGLDPEYAQAYVALADTVVLLAEGPERFGVLKVEIATTLAKQYVDKAVVREPELPMAFAVLGYIQFMSSAAEESISYFNKALDLNPNLAIARVWKSLALKKLQKYDDSLQELEKAYELDPLSLAITHNLGFKYSERGDFVKAKLYFKRLVQEYPESPLGYVGLADMSFSEGDYAASLKNWRKAFQISPENDDYKFGYIETLIHLGIPDKIREIEGDISRYETNLLLMEEKYDEVFSIYDFQLEANKDDNWLTFEAGWYNALYGRIDQGVTLLSSIENKIGDEDQFAMPWCSPAIEIAWALRMQNQLESSKKILERCEKNLNESYEKGIAESELDYLAARIHALENNPKDAISHLKTAINKGWRENWTKNDPLFTSIKGLPEFHQQMEIIMEDLAAHRKKALDLFND